MRHFILLLIFPLGIFSCGEEKQSEVSDRPEAGKPAEERVIVQEGADTLLSDSALFNRLRPAWTIEEVLGSLPGAEVTAREPVQNRHIPSQTDTLLTISNGESRLNFYQLPQESLLQQAVINDPGLRFGDRLEVGVSAATLQDVLRPLHGRDTLPEKIVLEGERAPMSLEIHLEEGAVSSINYEGYVD